MTVDVVPIPAFRLDLWRMARRSPCVHELGLARKGKDMNLGNSNQERAGARLMMLIARIDQLEAKVDGRLEYEEMLQDLRAMQYLIARRLSDSDDVSGESWPSELLGPDKALADLQDSLEEACDLLGLPSRGWRGRTSPPASDATTPARNAA
jgi:hypothetical protein